MKPVRSLLALLLLATLPAAAQSKVTYDEQILPLLRNQCLKCHNPDKLKGDLDLSTYSGALKGGGSGVVLIGGNPDGSKLFKSITHAEEPNMPPNSGKIPDQEIASIKAWITGGLLENSGSKALISNKPKVDLSLSGASFHQPAGPPPMPEDSLLDPVIHTARTSASTALASSPWAPLVALGGQRQVLLYNTDTLDLAGVLPFPEGFPNDVKFSRNGKLLLVGGGRGSKAGLVVVFDVAKGERILTVGDEMDSVLAADISSDQQWVALGGPSKLIKIFSTKTGDLVHKIKKHTDWITALEFSPDSKFLATGDRNGGLQIWETDGGEELYSLTGHKGAITGMNWRGKDVLVTASEDGTAKIWKMDDGQLVRTITAHNGGALAVKCSSDGKLITCGRDNTATVWSIEGNKLSSFAFTNDLPVRVTLSQDGRRAIGTDWAGHVYVWTATNGVKLGELSLNPPTLDEQLKLATQHATDTQQAIEKTAVAVTVATTELNQAKSTIEAAPKGTNLKDLTKAAEVAEQKVATAKLAAEQAPKDFAAAKAKVDRLKIGQFFTQVYKARAAFADQKKEQERLLAEADAAKIATQKSEADRADAKKEKAVTKEQKTALTAKLKQLNDQIKDLTKKTSMNKSAADKLTKPLAADKLKMDKLNADYQKLKSPAATPAQAAKL